MSTSPPLVTLTTDFGLRDPYVAAMKGVIASRCPAARIIDLGHEMPPQDVRAAAFFIDACLPYFPAGTIHVAVVDPEVGTDRRPIAVRAGGHVVVSPDNGLTTLLLRRWPLEEARIIEHPAFRMPTVSDTFHGRDIFAPAAAALASGRPFEEAGPIAEGLVTLNLPEPRRENGSVSGAIVYIDRFGNCITNIARAMVHDQSAVRVRIGEHEFSPLRRAYAEVEPGELLVLSSSTGHIEVAVRQGSAAERLGIRLGDVVEVTW